MNAAERINSTKHMHPLSLFPLFLYEAKGRRHPTRVMGSARCHRLPAAYVRFGWLALMCLIAGLLSACGTRPAQGGMIDHALKLVGLETIEVPAEIKAGKEAAAKLAPPSSVKLRLHAGDQLNSKVRGSSLSVVVKIYKLKGYDNFIQLGYDAFTQPQLRSEDILSSRELVLRPGQRYEVEEPLPPGATHLAVVALFAAPEEFRWRFVFDTRQTSAQGITLGAHRCALSVAEGSPVGSPAEALRLAGTTCR
jgi:type VI secretion system protein VasD